jgi:hypothetical protein
MPRKKIIPQNQHIRKACQGFFRRIPRSRGTKAIQANHERLRFGKDRTSKTAVRKGERRESKRFMTLLIFSNDI